MNLALYEQQVPRLLVIDDDTGITGLFHTITEDLHLSVKSVNDYQSMHDILRGFQPDIIFLDLQLEGCDGVEVLDDLAEAGYRGKVFIISGMDQSTLEAAAEVGKLNHLNVVGTIRKPFNIDDIERILKDETDTTSSFSSQTMENLFGTGEFRILFQPCMAIKSLGGMGVADLDTSVNWYGYSGTAFVATQSIFPKLESRGLINRFSHDLLEKSFESLNYCNERGMQAGIVVRLHDSVYQEISFPSQVLYLTHVHKVSSGSITLGLSDETLMTNADQMLNVLTRLRIHGFNVSVQISNTSTAELDRLLHLPVNEVRLSSRMINSIALSVDNEFEVCSFISQCDKRGLSTRAEGIDSEHTLKLLYESGCTTGSGPFFAAPMKLDDVADWASCGEFTQELRTI
jgi:EAL domain-containing protein (putative c-di-GMP-specific phosphodiesterase class I)